VKATVNKAHSALVAGVAGVSYLMVAVAAYASEAAAEGTEQAAEAGGISAILPPLGELIPVTIAFLILLAFMWKFALPSVVESLDQRAENIRESLEKAEGAKIEAEQLLADYKETMAEARKEAASILAQAKQAGETTRAEASAKAQVEYDAMIVKAREAIVGEKNAAIAELQASVARLSVAVAGKLIGSELSVEDHLGVIEKYVNEAGSINGN
jgi:F-type H+-transporting ATPase subunit b